MSKKHPFFQEVEDKYIKGPKVAKIETIPGVSYRLWHYRSRYENGVNMRVTDAFAYAKYLNIPKDDLYRLLKKHFD